MIKKYQNSAGVMTRAADILLILLSWIIAYPIRFERLKFIPFSELPAIEPYYALLPLILIVWVAGFQFFGVYRYDRVIRRSTEIYTLLRAHVGTLLLFTSLTYFITQYRFSRGVIITFGVLVFLFCWLFRVVSRKILRVLKRKGIHSLSLVAVGEGEPLQHLLQQIGRYPELGLEVVRVIQSQDYERALELIRECHPRIVVIGLPRKRADQAYALIQALKDEAIELHVIPDYHDYFALGASVESFAGIPLIQLNESPLFGYQAWMKRLMDFTLAGLGLLLFSPVFFLVALAIRLTSRGPIFYRQERMGLDGRNFWMYKFRSMRIDAEDKTGAVWAIENDNRRTVLGTFLRSTSIDELPQLWNVLVGDMSLVGPRPERPVFVSKFRHEIPNYMLRHKVKTGITGWAQINGWRGDTSLEKRIECDLFYIRNWSVWFDLKILFLTLFKGFVNKNAY